MTDNIFSKHKELYLQEANAHIENISMLLLELEKNPSPPVMQKIFHSIHTLKGNAATMQFEQTKNLCHAFEDLLTNIKENKISVENSVDLLFKSLDSLDLCLQEVSKSNKEIDLHSFVDEINQLIASPQQNIVYEKPVRKTLSTAMEKIQTINVKVEYLDSLMKLAEELLVNRLKMNTISENLNQPELGSAIDTMERLVTELQYNIMQARLLPLRIIFGRFPRMVRDLAKEEDKEILLQTEGADIELDRALLDELAEALTHLIRNAIDHGIETVKERIAIDKSPQGTIKLIATRTKEYVTITVSDDGQGLDWPEIKKEAIKKNLVDASASHAQLSQILFKGISTSKEITEISGRGMGLAIAKQKIDSIGGSFEMESKPGDGVVFSLKIPLTLAVIKVLFIKVNAKIYAIPLDNIERLLIINEDELHGLFNNKAIILAKDNVPIVHLAELFSEPVQGGQRKPVIIVNYGDQRLGLCADQLLSTEEIVIKPLSKVVKVNRLFSGSALVGSGEVVLILDIANLFGESKAPSTRRSLNASI